MTWRNQNELIQDIEAIPEFVFRAVALDSISGPPPEDTSTTTWQAVPYSSDRAITETGNHKPLAFTSGRYTMIQFADIFKPLVDSPCLGRIKYDSGFAVLDVFPDGDAYMNPDGSRIGITAYNSVNKTSAMVVKFSVLRNGKVFTMPRTISGFYKAHVGKLAAKTQNYLELVNGIRDVWSKVVSELSAMDVSVETFDGFTKDFETDPRILKELKTEIEAGTKYNMWELTLSIYDKMESRFSKTDVHRRKRIDAFINSITGWSTLLSLGGI